MDEEIEKLLAALRHPMRRSILTIVIGAEGAQSPKGLAVRLNSPISNVSYHVRALARCDALRLVDEQPVRGSMQHFYEPTDLSRHPISLLALGLSGPERRP